jgi:Lrp/AsnC family leucine-responsive transcriptional regulator
MLDEKDLKILEILKQNAKLTIKQMAKKLGMPATTVYNRIKGMEESGIIKNYTITLNHKKIGKNISAYILFAVNYRFLKKTGTTQHDLAKRLRMHEFVEEVGIVTGTSDIIVKVRIHDIDQLDKFITEYLRNIDGVEKTQTMVILAEF